VPDASKITPPVVKPGYRAGHDITMTVNLDAGMEVYDIESKLHEVEVVVQAAHGSDASSTRTTITLKNGTEIPNKDFILRYRLATDEIDDAFLVHSDERGTFFTLVLQPPQRVVPGQIVPRELVFVLDTSGSMRGSPIKKAKEVMGRAIDTMQPFDTFNLITFAGNTRILWDAPRASTPENVAEAQRFLAAREGGGGTEMMRAINAALMPSLDSERIRIVCFMTDGYVGNDLAIIDAVKANTGTTRVFSFGIGNAVNRFLLDGMAHAGRGEVEYVTLASQSDEAADRFHERILAPVLADIEIDWGDLPVADVYPKHFPDLFIAKPLMIHGRLTGPPEGTITLSGHTGSGPAEWEIPISTTERPPDRNALASLWARAKVEDLMQQDLAGLQSGNFPEDLRTQITAMGVEFRLMTQFTSFVAVEEMTVTVGGEPTTIAVPVEMPDGVSYEGVFGRGDAAQTPRSVSLGLGWGGGGSVYGGAGGAQAGGGGGRGPAGNRKGGHISPARRSRSIAPAAGARTRHGIVTADGFDTEPWADLGPEGKLDEALRGLAEKVAKDGKDGNLTVGKLRVIEYKIDVMIYLRDTSPETTQALKALGFVQTGESKAIKLLVGTIDVRKLEALVQLDAVTRVRPVAL
jgi:Ca-activated chloride channel family protein